MASHAHSSGSARRGAALVLAITIVITLIAMAFTLTSVTVGRIGEQKSRQADITLLAAAESAANETIAWMQSNASVLTYMSQMPVASSENYPATVPANGSVLSSSAIPTVWPSGFTGAGTAISPAIPAVHPDLKVRTNPLDPLTETNSPLNRINVRNGCMVATRIIKVRGSATAGAWPDGTERFKLFSTATYANGIASKRQRLRITSIIQVNRQVSNIFTRAFFSYAGYTISGSVIADSWDGNAGTTPYAPVAPHHVGPNAWANANGDAGSVGTISTGGSAQVHGDLQGNLTVPINPIPYSPPSTGITSVGAVTAARSFVGTGATASDITHFRATRITGSPITISGTGVVRIYVDGQLDMGDLVFAGGSTATVQIIQNSYTISGPNSSTLGNAGSSFGDPANPGRTMILSNYTGTSGSAQMKLNGGASFSAVVYAPYAGIQLNGNSTFYGSITSGNFSGAVNGNFSFHYDESLADVAWPFATPRLTAAAWSPRPLNANEP